MSMVYGGLRVKDRQTCVTFRDLKSRPLSFPSSFILANTHPRLKTLVAIVPPCHKNAAAASEIPAKLLSSLATSTSASSNFLLLSVDRSSCLWSKNSPAENPNSFLSFRQEVLHLFLRISVVLRPHFFEFRRPAARVCCLLPRATTTRKLSSSAVVFHR